MYIQAKLGHATNEDGHGHGDRSNTESLRVDGEETALVTASK